MGYTSKIHDKIPVLTNMHVCVYIYKVSCECDSNSATTIP